MLQFIASHAKIVVIAIFLLSYLFIILFYNRKLYVVWIAVILLFLFRLVTLRQAVTAVEWNVVLLYFGMLFVSETFLISKMPDYLATAVAGKAEDTIFCKGCVDVVFYSMDLHDFNDPAKVLHNAYEMVKPDGLVADLDWKKVEIPFGPPVEIKFSEQHVEELMRLQGLQVQDKMDVGPYHYLVMAKPVKKSG